MNIPIRQDERAQRAGLGLHAIALAAMTIGLSPVWAQEPAQQACEMDAMPGMDHGKMDHGSMPGAAQDAGQDMNDMNHAGGMDHGSMQGGSAPPDARDPHAYSGGYDFGPIPPPHMGDTHLIHGLLVDRLERAHARDNSSTEYDLQAWYGRTYDRAVLKAEGEIDGGKSQEARTELLWGHAVATYWDTQLGARYDSGVGPDRKWLAFGVQGLAPYWFEVEATGYVGEGGRTALRLDAEYELLLTQKLILQPKVEANFYGKSDAARERGSGLSDLAAGIRLRYEIKREFAPYIGIERSNKYGGSADFARAEGKQTSESRVVAGLRFWF
ncbi:MAG: copper resistance protein B [Gammaproteobacteria bacterium]|nr:copper resistance protein B [Gammaproteobacteria bacterium]